MAKFKNGDTVVIIDNTSSSCNKVGDVGVISNISTTNCKVNVPGRLVLGNWHPFSDLKLTNITKPSGGPSEYYDFPFKDWVTVNDMIEYLSEKQWGKYSWIFKDIVKACTRWGSKDGTTYQYDAKKIIYYGARLLMSVTDKTTLRKYLQELLDDKQFKEKHE